jgi:hypothetical protein
MNLFVAQLQGVANRNLLYLRNLWLNPFRFLGLTRRRRNRPQPGWSAAKPWGCAANTAASQELVVESRWDR